jgi:putative RNA 2'-phosphotransferase
MTDRRLVGISKALSLILRHEPHRFGVVLDPEGYASLEDVLNAVRTRVPGASEQDIEAVIREVEPDKCRFSLSEGEIRANYGHSTAEKIVHEPALPPAVLVHGTSEQAVEGILQHGIRPMRRQYVHLTTNAELAARVGSRHGKVRVLSVDSAAAHAAGIVFYRANESFWLANWIPPQFVRSRWSRS